MLPNQNTIKTYHIYTYTFLDDLSCIQSPFRHFEFDEPCLVEDAIQIVGNRFKKFGWEGDGTIGIIWIPPFVDIGFEDTHGTYIWHVKQDNDGISFLASDVPLDFKRIADQNQEFIAGSVSSDMVPATIIETDVEWFLKSISDIRNEIQASLLFLNESLKPISQQILRHLLFHYQGLLMRHFNEFMDECYLRVLIEAVESGNPHGIKLKKTRINLDSTHYIPDADNSDDESASSTSTWFTIRGLITDMWRAYKWESFKRKTEMLFKSLEYIINEDEYYEIRKHVVIRNCVQHHEACLDRDSLKSIGKDYLKIRDGDETITIEVWGPILITADELYALHDIMLTFVNDFHKYVASRVPTRHYIKRVQQQNDPDAGAEVKLD